MKVNGIYMTNISIVISVTTNQILDAKKLCSQIVILHSARFMGAHPLKLPISSFSILVGICWEVEQPEHK